MLIEWVHHVQDLKALLVQGLQEKRGRSCDNALIGDAVEVVLAFLHANDIPLEADLDLSQNGYGEQKHLKSQRHTSTQMQLRGQSSCTCAP